MKCRVKSQEESAADDECQSQDIRDEKIQKDAPRARGDNWQEKATWRPDSKCRTQRNEKT